MYTLGCVLVCSKVENDSPSTPAPHAVLTRLPRMLWVHVYRVNHPSVTETSSLTSLSPEVSKALFEVYTAISEGAETFLHAEYKICGLFVVCFGIVIFTLITVGQGVTDGFLTMISFVTGAVTSMVAG